MNERNLKAGLTIPYPGMENGKVRIGAARATRRLGPHGHQIYEVNELLTAGVDADSDVGSLDAYHDFVEMPPEP